MSWIYRGLEIDDIVKCPENSVGFIYRITQLEKIPGENAFSLGKFYIGKKQLYSNRRVKITQKEKAETGNNRKQFKQVIKESDWKTYNSSSKELQQEIKNLGEDAFVKEILEFCFSKRELSYKEVKWQFKLEVLENNTYNGNILSRFFKKKEV